jgi:hypothetical protein
MIPEKPGGATPMNRHGSAVDDQWAVQDAGVGAEARAPEVVAQDDHRMPARNAIVLRAEQAANRGRDTEGGEVVARDEEAVRFGALPFIRHVRTEARVRGQLQTVVLDPLEIPEQRIAEDGIDTAALTRSIATRAWTRRGHQYDLGWRGNRQPAQDQPIEEREMAELMPMPRASDRIATLVTSGRRTSDRTAYRRS